MAVGLADLKRCLPAGHFAAGPPATSTIHAPLRRCRMQLRACAVPAVSVSSSHYTRGRRPEYYKLIPGDRGQVGKFLRRAIYMGRRWPGAYARSQGISGALQGIAGSPAGRAVVCHPPSGACLQLAGSQNSQVAAAAGPRPPHRHPGDFDRDPLTAFAHPSNRQPPRHTGMHTYPSTQSTCALLRPMPPQGPRSPMTFS